MWLVMQMCAFLRFAIIFMVFESSRRQPPYRSSTTHPRSDWFFQTSETDFVNRGSIGVKINEELLMLGFHVPNYVRDVFSFYDLGTKGIYREFPKTFHALSQMSARALLCLQKHTHRPGSFFGSFFGFTLSSTSQHI